MSSVPTALLKLENIRVYKDVRNNINWLLIVRLPIWIKLWMPPAAGEKWAIYKIPWGLPRLGATGGGPGLAAASPHEPVGIGQQLTPAGQVRVNHRPALGGFGRWPPG